MRQFNKRGDAPPAYESATVKMDKTYVIPIHTHNTIELHASVAHWTGQKFVLYETTQSIFPQRP
jgi:xanthine dehydrogenase YagR molybdenum-binding subunit